MTGVGGILRQLVRLFCRNGHCMIFLERQTGGWWENFLVHPAQPLSWAQAETSTRGVQALQNEGCKGVSNFLGREWTAGIEPVRHPVDGSESKDCRKSGIRRMK